MGKTKRDQKRRDKKGRILRNGESQRKDGRYAFVYTDCYGKQKFLYSWKLEPTDSLPTGCRPCLALREKEKNIQRDLHDGIVPYGGNLTVLDLVQKYIGQKKGVRHNTQANYDFVINIIKKEEFGTRRIDKIKLSDAKAWFIKLQADGRGYSSIHSVRGIVRPAFQMAVEDDLLRKNPFEFQLCTVVVNDSVTRQAITKEQEELFLEFIRNDDHYSKYYNGMFILFKTGLRISEFCGLTVKDIDLQERKINVNHQLQRTRGMQYVIEDTKTSSGTRMLPMTDEVYECFEQIVKNRKKDAPGWKRRAPTPARRRLPAWVEAPARGQCQPAASARPTSHGDNDLNRPPTNRPGRKARAPWRRPPAYGGCDKAQVGYP